jgi:hypothetical protein
MVPCSEVAEERDFGFLSFDLRFLIAGSDEKDGKDNRVRV